MPNESPPVGDEEQVDEPRRPRGATHKHLSALQSRRFTPDFAFDEGSPDEYELVRFLNLTRRLERTLRDMYDLEAKERAAMHAEYKETTFELKWQWRQVQRGHRQEFEDDCRREKLGIEAREAAERQDLYEAATVDFSEAQRLQEFRRKERIARQTDTLKHAVCTKEEEDAAHALALDQADEREFFARDERRGRDTIEEDEERAARALWERGVWGGRRLRLLGFEERGRARLVSLEAWSRDLELRTMQQTAIVANAEAFYRGKIADYEEPRRRDTIEQRFLRERDFVTWQIRARDARSSWAAEELGVGDATRAPVVTKQQHGLTSAELKRSEVAAARQARTIV